MVAINFQKQFAAAIESGQKTQTIRAKARCKPGDRLQLYTGMRTKGCRKLQDAVCTRVAAIKICEEGIYLNEQQEDDVFALRDGFSNYAEMAQWFRDRYGALPFAGFLIQWRKL